MRRTLRFRLAIVLATLALLAAACGDDTDDSADTSADDTSTTTTEPDSTTTEATTTTEAATTTSTTTTAAPTPSVPTPEANTVEDLFALGRPVVLGHAGGDQSWPHSTMYAFREAALAGTEVLEMDVQLTADGVLVVQHDDTVDRTTETTGRVRDLTYDELQALDNAYWWSDDWHNDEQPEEEYIWRGVRTGEVEPPEGYTADDFRVETFRSVAEAFPDHVLDVEIKIPKGDDGEDDLEFANESGRVLAAEIEELGRADSVVVVSFNDDVIAAFHEVAPDIPTSPGTGALTDWFLGGIPLLESHRVLQVPPQFDGLDVLALDGFLEKAREEGLGIWVWMDDASTQENPDFYESLLDFDIDGIIAGHPDLAVERWREIGAIP
ncbi:MAG: glycerophosphodiester phosphodiesterase family protein [Acidimicrobiales bacterium]